MEYNFKKIAASLGLAIPTCLLSFNTANAAESSTPIGETPSIQKSLDHSNDVVARLINHSIGYSTDNNLSGDHTDTHTDMGGNHADYHSNFNHTDSHTDYTTGKDSQCVHTDKHTNKDAYNRHTNTGNVQHTDYHSNVNYSSC